MYTAPSGVSILRMFFGYIGFPNAIYQSPPPGRLGWMFLSDGTVDQVDLDTLAVTHLGAIWQPMSPYWYADAVVWRPRFFGNVAGQPGGVLFGSPKGMYAWDGTTLYSPGDRAPDWLTSANEGPAISTIMPSGLPGILAMEVYMGHLWVAGEDVISFSAPGNGADFSTAGGGGSFGYSGNKLTYTYRDLISSGGYLFVVGDSSIDMINNVITFGDGTATPFTTNFNYINIDPMTGHGFPRKCGRWGKFFVTASGARPVPSTATESPNSGQGTWLTRGGEAEFMGQKIVNLWMKLDISQFYPTFATVTMFGVRMVLLNGMFTDPFGVKRSLLLSWNGVCWTPMSQNLNLTHIGYYEQDSICDAYGTDGSSLYHLFDHPDPKLPKRLSTKALKGKSPLAALSINSWKRVFMELHDNSGLGVALTGTLTTVGGGVPNGSEDVSFQLAPGVGYGLEPHPTFGQGILATVDLVSISPDFSIERIHLATEARTLFGA